MPADLSAGAYLVDGADLANADAKLTHDGSGLWAGLSEEIGLASSAGKHGAQITGGSVRPFTHSVMYKITGTTYEATLAAIEAFRRRCKPGQTVTLTRTMPDPDGTDANVSHTATARRVTDRPNWIAKTVAALDTDFELVDGPWFGASVAIPAVGTHTIKGGYPTTAITATLSAGAVNPVVTNTTNGYSFRYVGTVPVGGVVVDVRARTAYAGVTNVSSALRWGKADLLQLDPGAQTLTVSSGTASFTYLPAYL